MFGKLLKAFGFQTDEEEAKWGRWSTASLHWKSIGAREYQGDWTALAEYWNKVYLEVIEDPSSHPNFTPADAYLGRHTAIIERRKKIKKLTIQNRRLNHQSKAA